MSELRRLQRTGSFKSLETQNIMIDKAYLVSCTNSRGSDIVVDKLINEVDSIIATAENTQEESTTTAAEDEALTNVLPGFSVKFEGEIGFLDNYNINTNGIK
ncbi:mitochondrial Homoaconitase [Neonectria punicea]|uniref:Mitochondrial Homoaconitase n=1 Tax=Neonectria punicea TaxID=979145 RepID=A0ABR1HDD0_9HYPO